MKNWKYVLKKLNENRDRTQEKLNKNNTPEKASNEEQSKPLKQGAVRCSTCGRFMGRIGLIARIRLEVECNVIRTHLCVKEEYTYATGEYVHH